MDNINTELGKIFASYNSETEDFDKFRVITYKDSKYLIGVLNDNYDIDDESVEAYDEEGYKDFKHNHTLLKSEGILTLTSIVAAKNDNGTSIKDVALIYFPNDELTEVPDINKPYIVARQALNNIFADMSGQEGLAGLSVSLDTLPTGYTLGDFMDSMEAIDSKLMHIYKIDTPDKINFIFDDEDIENIFKELYNKRLWFGQNTGEIDEKYEIPEDDCISGYCNSLKRFISESGFYEDLLIKMNIVPIDKELTEKEALSVDDKLLLATLCGGGIKMDRAVPLKFDYDIDLKAIKMNYLLARNINGSGNVYIVPYTVSPEEIDAEALYKMNEERTTQLQNRLMSIVKAYDKAKGNESISGKDFTAQN